MFGGNYISVSLIPNFGAILKQIARADVANVEIKEMNFSIKYYSNI